MYLLHRAGGYPAQETLWQFFSRGVLQLHVIADEERVRMQSLMKQYRDTPMDLADASLVATAETRGLRRVFTVDSDFYVYRIGGAHPFDVLP